MSNPPKHGQWLRADPEAQSTNPDLPAFIAKPADAPVYYGFPLLANSERDGFVFGTITEPSCRSPTEWGDAYVVAPDGSRAGIIWSTTGEEAAQMVMPPEPGRWGVYGFRF